MQVFIFGARAHGKVVLDIFRERDQSVEGWLDDDSSLWDQSYEGLKVLGGVEWARQNAAAESGVIVAIGKNSSRIAVARRLVENGLQLINAIHPSAVVSRSATLGRGVCVCAGAFIGPGARVGDNVLINTHSSVDHDGVVEDGAMLAPGVITAGAVTIGRGAYVSTGAVLVAGVRVGEGSVVAAGSIVTKHIPHGVLAMGSPAKVVREIDANFNWARVVSGLAKD